MSLTRTHAYTFMLFLALVGIVVCATAGTAFAQAGGSAGAFVCYGSAPTGALYELNSSCPTTLEFDHLFSFLVCNMEQLSSNLLGAMFCGMITTLAPAVTAVLTLAVVFFGAGFMIGVIPATAREFQVFLLKIAFVAVFATQSDYLIGIGYKLLVNGMRDGVDMVLSNYATASNGGTTVTVYDKLDQFLSKIIEFTSNYLGVDQSKTNNTDDACKDAIFAVMAVMAIAFPPFAFLGVALLMRITITFLRAVFGYIYAMVGIAFLLTLAPFFLSFYLFKQTRSFFDKWIGYLVSFALQIVILFAFLAFILSVDVSHVTKSFTAIVMEKDVTKEGGSFRAPWEYCTLCDFEAFNPATGAVIPKENFNEFLGKGQLRCKLKDGKKVAIELDTTFSAAEGQLSTLMQFSAAGMMSLLVLAYILEGLLTYAGFLAQIMASSLGGATYAPQLGGGTNPYGRQSVKMPFDDNYKDFEQGFDRGFATQTNSASGLISGFRSGISNMGEGKIYQRDKLGGTIRDAKDNPVLDTATGGGFGNRFIDWLTDPNRMGHD